MRKQTILMMAVMMLLTGCTENKEVESTLAEEQEQPSIEETIDIEEKEPEVVEEENSDEETKELLDYCWYFNFQMPEIFRFNEDNTFDRFMPNTGYRKFDQLRDMNFVIPESDKPSGTYTFDGRKLVLKYKGFDGSDMTTVLDRYSRSQDGNVISEDAVIVYRDFDLYPDDTYFYETSWKRIETGDPIGNAEQCPLFLLRAPSAASIEGKQKDTAMIERGAEVKVLVSGLRIRSDTSTAGDIVGTAEEGKTYPVYKIAKSDNYYWLNIGNGQWIAYQGNWCEYKEHTDIPNGEGLKFYSKTITMPAYSTTVIPMYWYNHVNTDSVGIICDQSAIATENLRGGENENVYVIYIAVTAGAPGTYELEGYAGYDTDTATLIVE